MTRTVLFVLLLVASILLGIGSYGLSKHYAAGALSPALIARREDLLAAQQQLEQQFALLNATMDATRLQQRTLAEALANLSTGLKDAVFLPANFTISPLPSFAPI